jgi:prolyl 4-hydroxylase
MMTEHATAAQDEPVAVVDDFLSAAECTRLLAQAKAGEWVASSIVEPDGTSRLTGGGRRSGSLILPACSRWATAKLRDVETRLSTRFGIEARNLEPWQFTRYRRGDFFDYHLDCGAWADHPSGERKRTILIVLEQPLRGGATHFRALGKTIRPLVGRLVVWHNLLPTGRCNYAMIHSGRPVWQGRKTILTTWERQRPYRIGEDT